MFATKPMAVVTMTTAYLHTSLFFWFLRRRKKHNIDHHLVFSQRNAKQSQLLDFQHPTKIFNFKTSIYSPKVLKRNPVKPGFFSSQGQAHVHDDGEVNAAGAGWSDRRQRGRHTQHIWDQVLDPRGEEVFKLTLYYSVYFYYCYCYLTLTTSTATFLSSSLPMIHEIMLQVGPWESFPANGV